MANWHTRAIGFIVLAVMLIFGGSHQASADSLPTEFQGKWIMPNTDSTDIKSLQCDGDVNNKNILTVTRSKIEEEGEAFGEVIGCVIQAVKLERGYRWIKRVFVEAVCSEYEGRSSGSRPLKTTIKESWKIMNIEKEIFMIRSGIVGYLYRKCR